MTTFASLSVTLGVYGYGIGAWFVLIPTLLAKHHGAARLASSYGLVRLFHGLMNFISPQISGEWLIYISVHGKGDRWIDRQTGD